MKTPYLTQKSILSHAESAEIAEINLRLFGRNDHESYESNKWRIATEDIFVRFVRFVVVLYDIAAYPLGEMTTNLTNRIIYVHAESAESAEINLSMVSYEQTFLRFLRFLREN